MPVGIDNNNKYNKYVCLIPCEEYYGGKGGKLNRIRECGRQNSKMTP